MKTIAVFSTDRCPDREPDFLSNSYSAYWDLGHGVIRSSDHWAGWSLCTGQASCIWGFEAAEPTKDDWKTGYCAYSGFRTRRLMPVHHPIGAQDRIIAQMFRNAGGFIDLASCCDILPLPAWVSIHPADSVLLPTDVRSQVRQNKGISRLIYARPSVVNDILDGASEVRISHKLEEPDWILAR